MWEFPEMLCHIGSVFSMYVMQIKVWVHCRISFAITFGKWNWRIFTYGSMYTPITIDIYLLQQFYIKLFWEIGLILISMGIRRSKTFASGTLKTEGKLPNSLFIINEWVTVWWSFYNSSTTGLYCGQFELCDVNGIVDVVDFQQGGVFNYITSGTLTLWRLP